MGGVRPRGGKPKCPIGRLGQDHRHCLGVDGGHFCVRLGCQKPEQIIGRLAIFHFARRYPARHLQPCPT